MKKKIATEWNQELLYFWCVSPPLFTPRWSWFSLVVYFQLTKLHHQLALHHQQTPYAIPGQSPFSPAGMSSSHSPSLRLAIVPSILPFIHSFIRSVCRVDVPTKHRVFPFLGIFLGGNFSSPILCLASIPLPFQSIIHSFIHSSIHHSLVHSFIHSFHLFSRFIDLQSTG